MGSDTAREVEDDHFYLPYDGVNASAPWRIAAYDGAGALTQTDMDQLGREFDLGSAILDRLSREIGNCLNAASEVNLLKVSPRKAFDRARKDLERAVTLARRVEKEMAMIRSLLTPLSERLSEPEHKHLLATAKLCAGAAGDATDGLADAIDLVIQTPGAAARLSPADKRKAWDKRREYVVQTCCHAWRDAGRKLSFTTISDGSRAEQRQGPLIEFIQRVTSMVTEPSTQLSGETIRKDIERFRKQLNAPDQMKIPPDRR